MKKYLIILLLLTFRLLSYSQQMPIYSQYLLNDYLINPAAAGSDGYTSINITSRQQWKGLTGAPEINSLSFQTRILKRRTTIKTRRNGKNVFRHKTDGKVGLGGYIYNYSTGVIRRTGFGASYVYHTKIRSRSQLSLSLGLKGYHLRMKEEDIEFELINDPVLSTGLRRGIFVPDLNFGVRLLESNYTIGFSADQLLGAVVKVGSNGYENYKMDRHYYLMGSYSFFKGREMEFKPSFLLKMSEQLRPQLDIGFTYTFDNFKTAYWTGITYRTDGAIITSTGIRADNLFFGYSFDFSLHPIQLYSYGTHEITVAMKFGDSSRRFRWLERY